jgi:hypothetical protein
MLFSVKKFSITTTIAIILTLLACGQRVENPLDNPGSGIYTAGGGLVSIDIGDGLITKESPITPLSDTFQVVLTKQPAADVTIGTIISSNTGEVVVSTASLTFTTANWDVPQTVTVTGVDDLVLDGMQTVFIDLGNTSSIDPDWDNLDLGELVVNNLDDETPTTPAVILLIGDGLITREHPTTPWSDTFNVVLNSAPASDVTINPIVSTDTGEVIVSTATLTFTTANWDVPQTITVTGVDDAAVDGMQAVTVNMGSTSSADPSWNAIAAGSVTVYNLDDESPPSPGVIVNAGSSLLVSEDGNSSSFQVVLKSQPTVNVSINVSVSDPSEGTITFPFAGANGVITFTPLNWNTPQTITVAGMDDAITDGNQPFTVVLGITSSTDPNYDSTFNPPDVSFINIDNESPGVTVNAGSSMLVSENGNTSSFQIVLNAPPTANVDISVNISDISEGTIQTPFIGTSGTITFTPGNWSMPQTVIVEGVDDAITDGNQPFNVVLGITSSTDPNYDSTFNPPDVSFINIDNESPGVTVNAGSSMLVSENGDTSSFDIVLNAPPTANVTINVSVDDPLEGTIIFPFAGANGIITFTPLDWDTPQTIIVSGVNDNIADGNQPFNVVLGVTASGDTNYGGIFNPPDVAFTNVDDDHAGITVNIGNGLITKEHPTTPLTDIFEVVLNSEPTANVTLNSIVSTDIGEVTVNPGTLTFTPLNWFMPQQVTVTGVDDAAVDGIISVNIDLGTATSGDPNYDAFDPGDVTVFNIDDEAPYQVIVIPDTFLITSENGGTVKLKVVLNNAPTLNVTLSTIQSLDPSEGTVSPSSLTFTPTDWNVPHEIIVTGLNDGGPGDGDVIYNIDLGTTASGDPNWNGIDPGDVSLTNNDYMYIGDYTWNSVLIPGSFIAISGTGTLISSLYWLDPQTPFSPLDEGYYIVPLGFSFNFLGKYYSQIAVYTNGFASFSNEILNFNNFANQLLFQVWPPDEFVDILAPWWEDLTVSTGNMYYRTTGVSGSRVLTIEWDTVEVIGNNETYTFQLKLYETTNIIKFIYGDKTTSGPTSTSASIGLKDDATIDPLFYWFDGFDGTIGNDATYGPANYGRSHADFPLKDTVITFTP